MLRRRCAPPLKKSASAPHGLPWRKASLKVSGDNARARPWLSASTSGSLWIALSVALVGMAMAVFRICSIPLWKKTDQTQKSR